MYVIDYINQKPEGKHFKFPTLNDFENCICSKHTLQKLEFFEIDEILNDYIHCHEKKYEIYLLKNDS